jgi:hypothetical protein
MTLGQSIEIGGARFYFLRIVILATWLRMIIRRDHTSLSFNSVDKAFLMWACFSIFVGFIPKPIHPDAVEPAATFTSTLIHQGGFVLDGFGTYFLVRHLIRDSNDIVYALRVMVIICLVLAGFMAFEKLTRRNLFSVFGVVPEITMERDGRFRCQGPFTHPIHAGNYGATLMPACIGLWFFGFRKFAGIAFLGAAMVTIASASSGPLMACIYGLMAFCFLAPEGENASGAMGAAPNDRHTPPLHESSSVVGHLQGSRLRRRRRLLEIQVDRSVCESF